jgi:peptidoglycan/xylan/chitin deacetylase (PgdA/CDA1 family)
MAASRSDVWPGGRYGARVGVPRTLESLNRYGVKASFYVPAVAALSHPEEQQRVFAEVYEIGTHSWIHELNAVLPYEVERDLMF